MVSVGTLMGKAIAPAIGKDYMIKGSRFYDHAIELNAFGKQAADFTRILSKLTGIENLQKLTLVSLKDALPSWNVLAKSKHWCPLCLEECRSSNSIYEPLLWSFKPVSICAKHNVFLNSTCPSCNKPLPFLTRTSRNGFCSNCGCWLGSNEYKAILNMDSEQLLWEQYKVKSIERLIIDKDLIDKRSYANMRLLLNRIIQQSSGVLAFSETLGIPKSTISSWNNGDHRPSLDVLLRICFAFEINISELFKAHQPTSFLYCQNINNQLFCKHNTKNKPARVVDWIEIEQRLKNIIAHQELGSPSVREVARRLGCNERLLYSHFPDLSNQIAYNHFTLIQSLKSRRLEEHRNTVIEATTTLYNNGIYPTKRKVEALIAPELTLQRRENYAAWKDALQILKNR